MLVMSVSIAAVDEPADTVEKTGICKGLDLAITVESRECLNRQFQAVDGELNAVYKDLMARLDKAQKTTLRNAQRAWVKEKEVKCAQAGEEAKGGTLEAVLISACQVQMTEQRVTFLKHYKP
jgi:uncharacterized protein YecT (DUF1311 family)